MKTSLETLQLELQPYFLSRKNFYQLLHLLFSEPVNKQILINIGANANFHELEEIHEGGKILRSFFERLTAKQFEKDKSEYQRLFIGPGPLAAPPWESYYRSKEKLLFEQWTFQIRELYHQFGLQFAKENNEPDDHLLPELEFMIYLADLSFKETEIARINKLIASQLHFLEQHLMVWIPDFSDQVIENTSSQLYLGAAMLLEDFLDEDFQTLSELREVISYVRQ